MLLILNTTKYLDIEVPIAGKVCWRLRFPLCGSENTYLRKDQKKQDRESNSAANIQKHFVIHFLIIKWVFKNIFKTTFIVHWNIV